MHIRPANPDDLGAIMKIYDAGRRAMRENGNHSQWINGYPSRDMISDDISHGTCFVICADDVDCTKTDSAAAPERVHETASCIGDGAALASAPTMGTAPTSTPALAPGTICGVFMFAIGDDPTYAVIEDGSWLNDEPYGVIHRISSDGRMRGALRIATEFAFERVRNVRIDTHADNALMQRALAKAGYKRCGIIYCHDGSPRIAFQQSR